MFKAIRNRWKEARGDVAAKEAADILQRYYGRMDSNDRHWFDATFDPTMEDLEARAGPIDSWDAVSQREIAKRVMAEARERHANSRNNMMGEVDRLSANGAALLSLYIECHAVPGERAKSVIQMVDKWCADRGQPRQAT